MSYIVGTGYLDASENQEFFRIWLRNTVRREPHVESPRKVVVLSTHDFEPRSYDYDEECDILHCDFNLGHWGEVNSGEKQGELCGWSASVLALCLIAYNYGTDLVYKESDCLAFGPWLARAYADMGERDMVFGRKMESEPFMPCSQSLFIIRHRFLLGFVSAYLQLPPDKDMNPENKFCELEKCAPEKFARLSFGVDRERPIPFKDEVFYAQRFNAWEMAELGAAGLL